MSRSIDTREGEAFREASPSPGGRSVYSRARKALREASASLRYLTDVAEIPESSPVYKKIDAAIDDIYEALYDLPGETKHASRLTEKSPLVFPFPNRDMRFWMTSDRRRASSLLPSNYRRRVASAAKVLPSPTLTHYQTMTASQYLEAFEDAVITDRTEAEDCHPGYEKAAVVF